MVKQGKFAQVNQQKNQKQRLRQSTVKGSQQTISAEQAMDFILVRYHLSVKQAPLLEETNSRLIQEFMRLGNSNPWSMKAIMQQVIQQIDVNVPWQFYKIILETWLQTKKFLNKEIPALPLEQKILLMDNLTDATLKQMLAQKMASNWFINQFKDVPGRLGRITDEQVNQLAESFLEGDTFNWQRIAELNQTVSVQMPENIDVGTQKWLEQIQKYV